MGAVLVAAPHTPVDHTLAKEGTSALGSGRPFPLDGTGAKPLADRTAPTPAPATSAVHKLAPAWPILARIAEIAESKHSTATSDAKSSHPSYRVDSPHAAAPPIHTAPQANPPQRSGTSPVKPDTGEIAERQERALAFAPLPIRLTVQAWRLMQPYLGIIRFAAMLALMAIGGTSMTLMMGGFWHHAEKPPSPSTTAVDQTSTLQAEPATHEPKLRLDATTPPEAEPTSIAPTAIGPAETQSKPLMAIESTEAATETSPTEASPRRESLSDATAHVPAYPTTPYPAPTLPHFASESLPRVQTAEPAIATLKGVVEETQSR